MIRVAFWTISVYATITIIPEMLALFTDLISTLENL
jgi:hypothetical protein